MAEKDYTDAVEEALRHVRRPQDIHPQEVEESPSIQSDTGDQTEEEDERDETMQYRSTTVLPDAVVKFIDSMGNNFSSTAERCVDTAKRLRNIADMLDKRAKALKDAGPQLTADVRDWISLERDSNDLEKFYKSLADREEG